MHAQVLHPPFLVARLRKGLALLVGQARHRGLIAPGRCHLDRAALQPVHFALRQVVRRPLVGLDDEGAQFCAIPRLLHHGIVILFDAELVGTDQVCGLNLHLGGRDSEGFKLFRVVDDELRTGHPLGGQFQWFRGEDEPLHHRMVGGHAHAALSLHVVERVPSLENLLMPAETQVLFLGHPLPPLHVVVEYVHAPGRLLRVETLGRTQELLGGAEAGDTVSPVLGEDLIVIARLFPHAPVELILELHELRRRRDHLPGSAAEEDHHHAEKHTETRKHASPPTCRAKTPRTNTISSCDRGQEY